MLRNVTLVIALLVATLGAQTPDAWRVRVDRSLNAQDPDDAPTLKFVPIAGGFHITTGPAGTFWNPAHSATGDYTVKATFTLLKPSGHLNYYGLIFGASNIEGADQNYLYFMIAQNGSYVVRHRAGNAVYDARPRTLHDVVKQPDAKGQSTNELEVRVSGDTISYVVNRTVVLATPKKGEDLLQTLLAKRSGERGASDSADAGSRQLISGIQGASATTDGLVGFRVNHQLDVQVERFELQKP